MLSRYFVRKVTRFNMQWSEEASVRAQLERARRLRLEKTVSEASVKGKSNRVYRTGNEYSR